MNELTTKQNGEIEQLWKKVTYEVSTIGTQCTVKCRLPDGFIMREYNRVFRLEHAKDLDMTDEQYILWQQARLFEDLIQRIYGYQNFDATKLIGS